MERSRIRRLFIASMIVRASEFTKSINWTWRSIRCIVVYENDDWFVTAGFDRMIKVWDNLLERGEMYKYNNST